MTIETNQLIKIFLQNKNNGIIYSYHKVYHVNDAYEPNYSNFMPKFWSRLEMGSVFDWTIRKQHNFCVFVLIGRKTPKLLESIKTYRNFPLIIPPQLLYHGVITGNSSYYTMV